MNRVVEKKLQWNQNENDKTAKNHNTYYYGAWNSAWFIVIKHD